MKEEKELTANEIKQSISAAKDIKLEEMKIPEWNTKIWVSALTYKERNEALEGANISSSPDAKVSAEQIQNFTMSVIIAGVRDAQGNRVFNKDDVGMLMGKNSSVIDEISTKITELSGFGRGLRESMKARFRQER